MNSLTIFFLVATVLTTFVTAKFPWYVAEDEEFLDQHKESIDGHENRREFYYPDKYECKNVEDCEQLYGTKREWTCDFGLCREEEKKDEHLICHEAACKKWCDDAGYRCTCDKSRHCIRLNDAIYSPDTKNSHPQDSAMENSQESHNGNVENQYHPFSTDDHSLPWEIVYVPLH